MTVQEKKGRPPKKKAPANTDMYYHDDRAEIADNYLASLGEDAENWATCYRSQKETAETTTRLGFELCKDKDENIIRHKGDPLCIRPKHISDREKQMPGEIALESLELTQSGKDGKKGLIDLRE